MEFTCGMCKNYTGAGDWNLCCTERHDPNIFPFGHLCYEDTPACEKFKPNNKITNIMEALKACSEFCCGECPYQHLDDDTYKMRCIHALIQDVYKLLKEIELIK